MQDFYHLKRDNNPLREDAFTLSCLGKLYPASTSDFARCGGLLSELLTEIISENDLNHDLNHEILIIGLTESGIIPALLMYLESQKKNLDTHLIYSTRRPMSGIAFNESHSHGPNHILPISNSDFKEIWIIEDEITSGNTVFNLINQLSSHLKIDYVRIFAFADFRNIDQKIDFISKTAENNINCSVHTLPFFLKEAKTTTASQPLILHDIMEPVNLSFQNNFKELESNWHLPLKRPALGAKTDKCLDFALWKVPIEFSCGTVLAVGESVDIAAGFVLANENLSFQQISLSPWKIDNKSIFSRMSVAGKYYLYNYEQLQGPVFIICDPIDREIEIEIIEKLKNYGIHVKPFLPIMDQYTNLPITGMAGS